MFSGILKSQITTDLKGILELFLHILLPNITKPIPNPINTSVTAAIPGAPTLMAQEAAL
jgi:hypothetical protein